MVAEVAAEHGIILHLDQMVVMVEQVVVMVSPVA